MSTYEPTTITVSCPTCQRDVLAEAPRATHGPARALRIPEHVDVREATIDQPRCPSSHGALALVPVAALREIEALQPSCVDECMTSYYEGRSSAATKLLQRWVTTGERPTT